MRARTRVLAFDHGTVRIGLAISDADGKIASPLETYTRRDKPRDAEYFRALIEREEVGEIVVGLPVHTNGDEGIKAGEARRFGAWLAASTQLPVAFFDERFTTVEAEAALWSAGLTHKQRKQRRDRVAAQILLKTYLDAGRPADQTPGPMDE